MVPRQFTGRLRCVSSAERRDTEGGSIAFGRLFIYMYRKSLRIAVTCSDGGAGGARHTLAPKKKGGGGERRRPTPAHVRTHTWCKVQMLESAQRTQRFAATPPPPLSQFLRTPLNRAVCNPCGAPAWAGLEPEKGLPTLSCNRRP